MNSAPIFYPVFALMLLAFVVGVAFLAALGLKIGVDLG